MLNCLNIKIKFYISTVYCDITTELMHYYNIKQLRMGRTKTLYDSFLKIIKKGIIDKFFNSVTKVRSLIIGMILKRGTVETNPGLTKLTEKNLNVVTYNCNGLGNRLKCKGILAKAEVVAGKGGIVMLQETHIVNDKEIENIIKNKVKLSNFCSNLVGVMKILSNDFEILQSQSDLEGRMLIIVAQNDQDKFLLVNVYCHNNHMQSINFVEKVFVGILEYLDLYPD